MKKAMVAVFAYAALSDCAEIVERPDADTLWIENGKALSVADKPGILTWQKKDKLALASLDNGFLMEGNGSTGIYIPVSKEFPWLCINVVSAERIGTGYHAFSINPNLDIGICSVVSRIPRGIYCIPLAAAPKLTEKVRNHYFRLDVNNAKIHFSSIAMVKEPPCTVTVKPVSVKKGDEVTITCRTRSKAQYVELKFYQTYTMPNLRIADDVKRCLAKAVSGSDGKEWTFSFKYEGFKGGRLKEGETWRRGSILLETVVETDNEVVSCFQPCHAVFE